MEIRKYQNSDFDQMMNLHREVLIKEDVYRGTGIWEDDLLNITDHYYNRNGEFLIGLDNGELIAMGAIRRISSDTAEIVRMRVHPDHQGKGCGNMILHELEKFARNNDYKELILETDERLINALKLYRKNGYLFWKEEIIDGYKCIWYRKYINQ